jgi:hypothetical protein
LTLSLSYLRPVLFSSSSSVKALPCRLPPVPPISLYLHPLLSKKINGRRLQRRCGACRGRVGHHRRGGGSRVRRSADDTGGGHRDALYSLAVIQFSGRGCSKNDRDLRTDAARRLARPRRRDSRVGTACRMAMACAARCSTGAASSSRPTPGACGRVGLALQGLPRAPRVLWPLPATRTPPNGSYPSGSCRGRWARSAALAPRPWRRRTADPAGACGCAPRAVLAAGDAAARVPAVLRVGVVNHCSRACQALHWKMAHKAECTPMDRSALARRRQRQPRPAGLRQR